MLGKERPPSQRRRSIIPAWLLSCGYDKSEDREGNLVVVELMLVVAVQSIYIQVFSGYLHLFIVVNKLTN